MRKLTVILLALVLTLGCLTAQAEGQSVYATLQQTGIDLERCLALIPENLTIEDNVVTLPDHEYASAYYYRVGNNYVVSTVNGKLSDGVWTFDFDGDAPSDVSFGVYASRPDDQKDLTLTYFWSFEDGTLRSIDASDPNGGELLGTDLVDLFIVFAGGEIDEYRVETSDGIQASYDAEGQLKEYSYLMDGVSRVCFDSQNTLIRIDDMDAIGFDPADFPSLEIICE